MSPQEMIDVIQAHKNGKQIEFRFKTEKPSSDNYWLDAKTPTWNFATYDYRVVPKAPKTMHQYLLHAPSGQYVCTNRFYSSIEDIIEDYKDSNWTVVKRLDHTKITITEQ
jgi:hypothetical protein